MTFYSYAYVESQTIGHSIYQYIFIGVLLIGWIVLSVMYSRNRLNTKYRDGSIILILLGLFSMGIHFSDFEHTVDEDNNMSKMTGFLSSIHKNTQVGTEQIRVNSLRLANGIIVKVQNNFYRVTFGNDYESYSLERVYLVNQKIKLVETETERGNL